MQVAIRRPSRRFLCAAALLLVSALTGSASGEDRISLRGAYFREASTRVVQPMLEVSKDLPRGYDVGVHLLVDAISSASIAQGVSEDGVFREKRYEGSVAVGKTWDHTRAGAFVRYSREPDYFSHTGGLTFSRDVWGNTGTIAANIALTHDDIEPTAQQRSENLDTFFVGAGYTQVLTPTTIAQAGYEMYFQHGFIGNPYISNQYGRDDNPRERLRHALAVRVAQYIPVATLGLQLHYRFYLDQDIGGGLGPWGMTAHTLEGRIFKELGPDFGIRLSYRHHFQNDSVFWCDSRADPSCYGPPTPGPEFHSADPKFGSLTTKVAELKVIWDMHALRALGPSFDRLAAGSFDLSYAYYFESAYYGMKFKDSTAPPIIGAPGFSREYGGAHVMLVGYTLPF